MDFFYIPAYFEKRTSPFFRPCYLFRHREHLSQTRHLPQPPATHRNARTTPRNFGRKMSDKFATRSERGWRETATPPYAKHTHKISVHLVLCLCLLIQVLISLRALANIGVAASSSNKLHRCVRNSQASVVVRLAALHVIAASPTTDEVCENKTTDLWST